MMDIEAMLENYLRKGSSPSQAKNRTLRRMTLEQMKQMCDSVLYSKAREIARRLDSEIEFHDRYAPDPVPGTTPRVRGVTGRDVTSTRERAIARRSEQQILTVLERPELSLDEQYDCYVDLCKLSFVVEERQVPWAEATQDDHHLRISWYDSQIRGYQRTRKLHTLVLLNIENMKVTCLRDVVEDMARRLGYRSDDAA